jgi:thiopurine S-methyltransferase
MEAAYWHDRWDNGLVGFHMEDVNPYLQKYWPVLDIQPGQKVFVPLCGKSVDMLWLAGQGYEVMGVEISPVAIETFFNDNGLAPEVSRQGDFEVFKAGNITLYCGDFFSITADMMADVDAIYDRASMVALPADMRQQYAAHLQSLCEHNSTPILLVSLLYNQQLMQGPPFSVSENEINSLYQFRYQQRKLCSCEVIENNARFKSKGLDSLVESVYLLSAKK